MLDNEALVAILQELKDIKTLLEKKTPRKTTTTPRKTAQKG